MAEFSKQWWGKQFIEVIENITDSARLSRGKSYVRSGKIKEYNIKNGKITAKVRGSVNPYFDVYKEPLYTTTIEFSPIEEKDWSEIITQIGSRASFISKLLMNEIPDHIETVFSALDLALLPYHEDDLITKCSCPDWSNPCKHIAGVYYLIASLLDQDPFLLFELRGISRQKLLTELKKTSLGEILSDAINKEELPPENAESFYTKPLIKNAQTKLSLKEFWQGRKPLPTTIAPTNSNLVGIVVKKAGDFPSFWHKDHSFITVMEEFYHRVHNKNKLL
jgi:uncharacterized Zn finger protein